MQRSNDRITSGIDGVRQRSLQVSDFSRLTRKQSHSQPSPSIDFSQTNPDSSALTRKPSHRSTHSKDNDELGRVSSLRNMRHQDSPSTSQKSSQHQLSSSRNSASAPSDKSKLTRHNSLRLDRPSDTEKEDRRRRRNRESARRARERERSERELMERAYDANEVRIKHLENIVDELSSELRRHNTISDTRISPRGGKGKGGDPKNTKMDQSDERPSWFGAAF